MSKERWAGATHARPSKVSQGNAPHCLPSGTLGSFSLSALSHPSAHASGLFQGLGLGYKLEVTLIRHKVFSAKGMMNEKKPNLESVAHVLELPPPGPLSSTNAVST